MNLVWAFMQKGMDYDDADVAAELVENGSKA